VGSARQETDPALPFVINYSIWRAKGPASWLQTLFDLQDASQRFNKLLKRACWKHNRISAPAHIFSYLKKPASLIFFEIEEKNLPLDLNFLGRERLVGPVWCIRVYHILPCLRGYYIPTIRVVDRRPYRAVTYLFPQLFAKPY